MAAGVTCVRCGMGGAWMCAPCRVAGDAIAAPARAFGRLARCVGESRAREIWRGEGGRAGRVVVCRLMCDALWEERRELARVIGRSFLFDSDIKGLC